MNLTMTENENKLSYQTMADEKLALLAKGGDEQAGDVLIRRYKGLVIKVCRSYFIVGAETDDLVQEGMIGLYKSILKYSEEKSKFITFAYQCVRNSVLDAIKTARRDKNKPLLDYEGLDKVCCADNYRIDENAEKLEIEELVEQARHILTEREKKVFDSFLNGYKTSEIAEMLNMSAKAVDNAIYRIKRKIAKNL